MHELSICQSLVRQLEDIAAQHHAHNINLVLLEIGPLSGVEPQLLAQAFPLASAGSVAQGAVLRTELIPIRVKCTKCGQEGVATMNNLSCQYCGDWQTQLLSGDECLLTSVELT